jgi:hypothetical protein
MTLKRRALAFLLISLASVGPSLAAEASRHWLVSVSDVAVSEESCTPHEAVFTVRLSKRVYNLPPQESTVDYTTADGTAIAGVDYTAATGTLTFTPPNQVLTVSVPITDALVPGPDKTFTLNLSNPSGAVLSRPIGTATLHAPTVAKCSSCALSCDDADVCTHDSCEAASGCHHVNGSAGPTPYCTLAGLGNTPEPDPNFAACSAAGEWLDSDGDGLSDAAEAQGYIDVNFNGVYDPGIDVPLPGADPNTPDVFVKYDYMVADNHNYQPPQAALDQVAAAYAAHGIALHYVAPAGSIPYHEVVTLDPAPTTACAGSDFVTMAQLRAQNLGNLKWAYHYQVFAHNATLPDTGNGSACPQDPECVAGPDPLGSGQSELPGYNGIVAFGADVDQGFTVGIERFAGTTMHELGHNFGLKHGSLGAPAPQTCITFKPNYVSIMGYLYQSGIGVATAPGMVSTLACSSDADCGPPVVGSGDCAIPNACHCTDDLALGGGNVCYRLDYSREKLLDLFEPSLDETLGVGGPTGDTDIVRYFAESQCTPGDNCGILLLTGPSDGPIDWNNDGDAADTDAQGDIDDSGGANELLYTADDWAESNGQFVSLDFGFQCTTAFQNDGGAPPSIHERGLKWVREHHVLHPAISVAIEIEPHPVNKEIAPGSSATVRVAVFGSEHLDVSQVDKASLRFHDDRPLRIDAMDVNGDGIPDLLLEFRKHDVRLSSHATRARLTGWLQNSRALVGEEAVSVR